MRYFLMAFTCLQIIITSWPNGDFGLIGMALIFLVLFLLAGFDSIIERSVK